jgi:hypothetical protein
LANEIGSNISRKAASMTSTRLGGTESESLSRFARGPTTADRAEALTSMLSRKELLRATRTEEFRAGLHGLLEGFESAANWSGLRSQRSRSRRKSGKVSNLRWRCHYLR